MDEIKRVAFTDHWLISSDSCRRAATAATALPAAATWRWSRPARLAADLQENMTGSKPDRLHTHGRAGRQRRQPGVATATSGG